MVAGGQRCSLTVRSALVLQVFHVSLYMRSASRARGRRSLNNSKPQFVPHVSVSNSQLPISAAISPSALHMHSHSYASLHFSLSRYLTPLPYPLSRCRFLICFLTSLIQILWAVTSFSLSSITVPASTPSSYPAPITSYCTGGWWSETVPELGQQLETVDSWSAGGIKQSGQLAGDQCERGSQDCLIFIERIGRLRIYWPYTVGQGQEASGLFCIMWKSALRVSEMLDWRVCLGI